MPRALLCLCLAGSGCLATFAQPAFEAASIKKIDPTLSRSPAGEHGGPGASDPGLMTLSGYTLKGLIFRAYGSRRAFQFSGPDWLDQQRFNVTAKVPAGTSKQQADAMLQNLLATRFNLKLHHESKQFPGFLLTIAKGGSKLKESAKARASDAEPQFARDKEGFSMLAPGASGIVGQEIYGHGRFYGRAATIEKIASTLEAAGLGGMVVNNTGLTGAYDFQLDFTYDNAPANRPADHPAVASDPDLSLRAALEKQLGLKVEETKLPYDVLVIDSADRQPTED